MQYFADIKIKGGQDRGKSLRIEKNWVFFYYLLSNFHVTLCKPLFLSEIQVSEL